ncbi:pilus assembly protein N-terminal domain-containing protein [Methylopila musalis]|uniref:Pilus assembly protein N-terminal domain-containing protein n=1 Tax=Methylopila musalis TaxID=1134781 RepID=A0ABW3Z538_9HYPH
MASAFAAALRMGGMAAAACAALVATAAHGAGGSVDVTVDRASILRAPEGTATIVIGNPMIADATVQRNGVLVVTGKSFGSTNIMLLNGAGEVVSETIVNVRRALDSVVTVQRANKRESLSCTPRCEPVLAIGDDKDAFEAAATQIAQRAGLAAGGSSMPGQ